ncbi:hypothetical protein KEM54_002485, partial [Ascosphaera aggregata]
EDSNYGLVEVSSDGAKELKDFKALQEAFQKTKPPTGSGGYNSTGGANTCPKKTSNWEVDPDEDLPPTPKQALKFMKDGPAEPKGFKGGSQTAGDDDSSDLKPGSSPKVTGSTTEESDASETSSDDGKTSGAEGVVKAVGMGAVMGVAGVAAAMLAL